MSGTGLFIYFRVARGDEAAARDALRELHRRWSVQWPQLSCELLRRRDEAGDVVTLMEIYRGVDEAQHPALEAGAAQAVSRWLVGSRHVEVFDPCA